MAKKEHCCYEEFMNDLIVIFGVLAGAGLILFFIFGFIEMGKQFKIEDLSRQCLDNAFGKDRYQCGFEHGIYGVETHLACNRLDGTVLNMSYVKCDMDSRSLGWN
jgi:hypothetical protein